MAVLKRMKINEIRGFTSKLAPKNWRHCWAILTPNPQGGNQLRGIWNFPPAKIAAGCGHWVCRSHSWRGTGRGQERDSPTLSGAARRPGKYLCPLSKAHQNARAANGTGGEDGPKLAAVGPDLHSRHLLSDRRALSPAVL